MKHIILLSTFLIMLYACQTKKSVLYSKVNMQGSVYSGTLPCTDCGGINQVVILDTGNKYRLSETYLGKADNPTEYTGNWKQEEDKIILFQDTLPIAYYAVLGNNLLYLNEESITHAASTNSPMLSRKKLVQSKELNSKYLNGVDIIATGSDDSWKLDINHKRGIRFNAAGDINLSFPAAVPVMNGTNLVYDLQSGGEVLKIILKPGYCNGEVNSLYDHKTTVIYKNRTYSGCGALMNTDGDLDGEWSLILIEGERKIWNEQPYLAVDLGSEKFYGNTGCNNINGMIRFRGDYIVFTDINAARSVCNSDDNSFIDAIVKCNGYNIDKGILSLKKDGKTVMTFKRN